MADKTAIEWCDVTPMIRADSGTIRLYRRKRPDRPGVGLRRKMQAAGLRWCRGCRSWMPTASVRQGVCRVHANEEYRRQYAAGGRVVIAARVHARKRSTEPISEFDREMIFEAFDNRCAYCQNTADTIDHVEPVIRGGDSRRGNLLPACVSCNSRKRTRSIDDFLLVAESPHDRIAEELCMREVL